MRDIQSSVIALASALVWAATFIFPIAAHAVSDQPQVSSILHSVLSAVPATALILSSVSVAVSIFLGHPWGKLFAIGTFLFSAALFMQVISKDSAFIAGNASVLLVVMSLALTAFISLVLLLQVMTFIHRR